LTKFEKSDNSFSFILVQTNGIGCAIEEIEKTAIKQHNFTALNFIQQLQSKHFLYNHFKPETKTYIIVVQQY